MMLRGWSTGCQMSSSSRGRWWRGTCRTHGRSISIHATWCWRAPANMSWSAPVPPRMCDVVAGSPEAFDPRPFLSLNINHVVPPMRFSPEAAEVLVAAARAGIPCNGQHLWPVGRVQPGHRRRLPRANQCRDAGRHGRGLAGQSQDTCGLRRPPHGDQPALRRHGGRQRRAIPADCDGHRTGAVLRPANSTIAGATDSKAVDVQSGYEKALSVLMAAQAGAD